MCIVCCDGLTALPDAIGVIWPSGRAAMRGPPDPGLAAVCLQEGLGGALTQGLRPIYTAPDDGTAAVVLDAFAERWDTRYPPIVNLWRSHWA